MFLKARLVVKPKVAALLALQVVLLSPSKIANMRLIATIDGKMVDGRIPKVTFA
jgi:hypothetical protein